MTSFLPPSGHPQFTLNEQATRYHRTKSKGDAAEVMAQAAFVNAGLSVCLPTSERSSYDLIVDDGVRLAKVQVKWARVEKGFVKFWSSTVSRQQNVSYADGDCDFFAAYAGQIGELYVVSYAEVRGMTCVQLRLQPPRNGQQIGIRWARDYVFTGDLPWPEAIPPYGEEESPLSDLNR